jgi:hypothetical protein
VPAPPVRPTPVGAKISDTARSGKQTLISPIPALLAASMKQAREDKGDATPIPVAVRGEVTSRFASSDQEALMMDDELEADYIVEVVDTHRDTHKGGR